MSVVFAVLTACAFSLPFALLDPAEIGALMPEHSIIEELTAFLPVLGKKMYPQCMLLFLLFFLFYRTFLGRIRKKQFSMAAFLTACVFTFCLLAGEYGTAYKDLSVMVGTMPQCVVTGLEIAGCLPFFYVLVRTGFVLLDERKPSLLRGKAAILIFEKHSFLLPFLIILICWLPYVILFYPGFVPSDGLKQLNNFNGIGNFTDHHPAFSSMLMGWAMRLGQKLGSDNLGIFLFTGPQLLVCISVMSCCFPLFAKLKTPAFFRILTLANFALLPVWPNYAYSLLKDSLYMSMILYYCLQLVLIVRNTDEYCARPLALILLTVSLSLLMLVRHEGQYLAAAVYILLFTLPMPRKNWKKLLPVIVIPLFVINLFNHVIRPALQIPDGPFREAITLPIRQTSAVVVSREDHLTEEHSAVLHELFTYEKITEFYPDSLDNADDLKGLFDPWASSDAILRYMKTWALLGIKNPLLYLNVLFCSATRYYDPLSGPYRDIYGWFGIEQAEYVNHGLFDIHYAPAFAAARSALINIAEGLPRLPLTSAFYSMGVSAWVIFFCLAYLLRKKIHGVIIPLLPGLFTIAILHDTAINGFFRYMLPVLISVPVCFAWVLAQRNEAR